MCLSQQIPASRITFHNFFLMNGKSTFYCENELVILLKANDKAAFEYLYDNYAAGLYGIIRRIVKDDDKAEDVMQDSFIKIWKNIASYDAGKGTLFM
jgi:RNA polymerase sigma-70 factor (ECF subfamily)